jgi:hypothetical protein
MYDSQLLRNGVDSFGLGHGICHCSQCAFAQLKP